jgi:SNF2 family DNA or RNA helicase
MAPSKSKKNYALVTGREYDMVIVDEAHHLKNRKALNWKLINDLQKRFLLLLTATPVENFLMELVRSSADKAIVFVKYQATHQYLSDFLDGEGVPHAFFHGGLTSAQKQDHIRRFEGRYPPADCDRGRRGGAQP